jgi:putative transposase
MGKRKWIDPDDAKTISVRRQCDLVGLPPSSYYYRPAQDDELTLSLLRAVDEEYTRHPFLGSRKMKHYLKTQGYDVNRKRVQRLYKQLGIEAIYCKPLTSESHPEHKIYPYLLRNLPIVSPDQVYCADITYIRMHRGFMYLVAVMDWFSRYVLGWSLSPSLDADFCIDLLKEVLAKKRCQIFNTDQGAQFTAHGFVNVLLDHTIQVSMDGRGRALDNVFMSLGGMGKHPRLQANTLV